MKTDFQKCQKYRKQISLLQLKKENRIRYLGSACDIILGVWNLVSCCNFQCQTETFNVSFNVCEICTWNQGVAFLQQSASHGFGIQKNLSNVLFEHGSGSLQRHYIMLHEKGTPHLKTARECFKHELLKLSWVLDLSRPKDFLSYYIYYWMWVNTGY